MKNYNTEAFVLKSINLKDADKMYTLFTKSHGKIGALAKGVRKVTSRRSGNLDTLNHIKVNLHENSAGYNYIEEVELLDAYSKIKKSLDLSVKGYFIAELVYRNLEEDIQLHQLFSLFGQTLKELSDQKIVADLVVGSFSLNFLRLLGYLPGFGKCIHCGKVLSKNWQTYRFDFDRGGLACGCIEGGRNLSLAEALVLYKMHRRQFDFDTTRVDYTHIGRLIKELLDKTLGGRVKTLDIAI